jgi:hypothetical protein
MQHSLMPDVRPQPSKVRAPDNSAGLTGNEAARRLVKASGNFLAEYRISAPESLVRFFLAADSVDDRDRRGGWAIGWTRASSR